MPILLKKYYPLRNIIFFLGEGILICFSLLLVTLLIHGLRIFMLDISGYLIQSCLVTGVFQLCLYFFDLYDQKLDLSAPELITRVSQAFGVGCIILGLIYYTMPMLIITTKVFWLSYAVICIMILVWRGGYLLVLRKKMFVKNILLLGTGKLASDICSEIEGRLDSPYKIVGIIGRSPGLVGYMDAPLFSRLDETDQNELKYDSIVVALDDRRGQTPVQTLLENKIRGVTIEHGATFYERLAGKVLVERVDPSWIIFSAGFELSRLRYLVKRLVDVSASMIILTLSCPVLLCTAIIIKLESRGPVFYTQERVGEKNRNFNVIKFRSMREDAEKDGAVWATVNDNRVTRFGGFMRKTRLDEIPQLFNVLKGEMSLVGPRPERPVFVKQLSQEIPYYEFRHDAKPGVTGWAQVCYPYGASVEDAIRKLEYDLYYMKNISIGLDLLIIFQTIKTVIFQKGSR